jgi:hypothetical protein
VVDLKPIGFLLFWNQANSLFHGFRQAFEEGKSGQLPMQELSILWQQ